MFNCRISANGTIRRNAASDGYQRSIKTMLPGGCLASTCWDIQARLSAKRPHTSNSKSRVGFLTNWLTRAIVSPRWGSLFFSQSRITFLLSALRAFVTASNSVVLPVPLGPSRETNSRRFILQLMIDVGIDELYLNFWLTVHQTPGLQPLMSVGRYP